MRITRKQAYQAHPVPSHAYYPPDDPLEPEITRQTSVYADDLNDSENERVFRCKNCNDIMYESDIEEHECE